MERSGLPAASSTIVWHSFPEPASPPEPGLPPLDAPPVVPDAPPVGAPPVLGLAPPPDDDAPPVADPPEPAPPSASSPAHAVSPRLNTAAPIAKCAHSLVFSVRCMTFCFPPERSSPGLGEQPCLFPARFICTQFVHCLQMAY